MLTDEQAKAVDKMKAQLRPQGDAVRKPAAADDASPPPKVAAPARPTPPLARKKPPSELSEDERWARSHLRWNGARVYADLANLLRIIEKHDDFAGRFKFNKAMGKVTNRGAIMLDWQMDDVCAQIQERFIPEVSSDLVTRALYVAANRAASRPIR